MFWNVSSSILKYNLHRTFIPNKEVFAEIKVWVGDELAKGREVAVVESVKASSDVTSPLLGKVIEINDEVISSSEEINTDPYGRAWLLKVRIYNPVELADLLDAGTYPK
jgi:glycine cleavage system H protein